MSDKREIFTIIENLATGEGIRLPGRAEGDAAGDNHAPVVDAKDSAGNYILHEKRVEGEASAALSSMPALIAKDTGQDLAFINIAPQFDPAADIDTAGGALPAMPVKNLAGGVQYINARDEGDAVSAVDALPVLGYKTPTGNFAYGQVNAAGQILISSEANGTPKNNYASVTPSAINTLTTVVDLVVTASKILEEIKVRGSSTFPVLWELVQVDDVTLTVKDKFITGAGAYSFSMHYGNMQLTAGATGVQKMRIRATQLSGAASDMHGYVELFERA